MNPDVKKKRQIIYDMFLEERSQLLNNLEKEFTRGKISIQDFEESKKKILGNLSDSAIGIFVVLSFFYFIFFLIYLYPFQDSFEELN